MKVIGLLVQGTGCEEYMVVSHDQPKGVALHIFNRGPAGWQVTGLSDVQMAQLRAEVELSLRHMAQQWRI